MIHSHSKFVKALQKFVTNYNRENGTNIQFRLYKDELSRGLWTQFFTKRNRWVANMVSEAESCPTATIYAYPETGLTIVEYRKSWCLPSQPSSLGIAQVAKGDKYDYDFGVALAFARATGKPIPEFIFEEDES
jgi:hypothetical protein